MEKVTITTTITNRRTYRIAVVVDGKFSHDLTEYTKAEAVKSRNRECDHWSNQAATVEANAVPDICGRIERNTR